MTRFTSPIPGAPYSSDGFGPRKPIDTDGDGRPDTGDFHYGQDIDVPAGTPILAAGAGVVIASAWIGTYGNAVYLDHGDGLVTRYAHMLKLPPVVHGQHVEQGERIGFVGSTGASTGPHLHFEVVRDGVRVDPLPYLTTTLTPAGQEDEDTMQLRQMHYTDGKGKLVRATFMPGTAYFVEWTGGASYANEQARTWETGSSVAVTESLYRAFQRAAEAMLPTVPLSEIEGVHIS